MKKLLLALIIVGFFGSCKKDNSVDKDALFKKYDEANPLVEYTYEVYNPNNSISSSIIREHISDKWLTIDNKWVWEYSSHPFSKHNEVVPFRTRDIYMSIINFDKDSTVAITIRENGNLIATDTCKYEPSTGEYQASIDL